MRARLLKAHCIIYWFGKAVQFADFDKPLQRRCDCRHRRFKCVCPLRRSDTSRATTYTFIYKHRNDRHRGGMKMSRAISLTLAYLLGVAGGIALIQGSQWGMYIVTVSVHAFSRHGRVGCLVDHDRHGAKGIGCRAKGKSRQLIQCPLLALSGHRLEHRTCRF